jgi:FKBP-type peptidyl-prolyl cis-trans isomerase FkpA
MPKAVAASIVLVLVLVAAVPAGAAGPELKTDEQKTLYALGLVIARNLASFYLTKADLEVVEAGITDGILKSKPKADLDTWGPKIQGLATTRAATAAVAEKKASQAFLDHAAAEQGAVKTASGLIITTLKPGDGASPAATDRVKVHYQGSLTDGTVFDSSVKRGEPLTIGLGGGVIKCWSEGVPLMKVGGKSRFVCPSDLAYGDQGRPPMIKPGATLVFEIELLEIVK